MLESLSSHHLAKHCLSEWLLAVATILAEVRQPSTRVGPVRAHPGLAMLHSRQAGQGQGGKNGNQLEISPCPWYSLPLPKVLFLWLQGEDLDFWLSTTPPPAAVPVLAPSTVSARPTCPQSSQLCIPAGVSEWQASPLQAWSHAQLSISGVQPSGMSWVRPVSAILWDSA